MRRSAWVRLCVACLDDLTLRQSCFTMYIPYCAHLFYYRRKRDGPLEDAEGGSHKKYVVY
jgi:hypothetical protein